MSDWHVVRISAFDHPNLDPSSDREIPGGPSRSFVGRIESEYGRESGVYQARVLGEFPETDVEALVRWSWFEDATDRFEAGELEGEAAASNLLLAVDVARYGTDETVLAVRQGPVLRELVAWRGRSTTETAARIESEAARAAADYDHDPETVEVVVDVAGVGGGVLDTLEAADGVRATSFNAGRRAHRKQRFLNRRAESFWTLRRLLEEGQIAVPPDEQLAEELTSSRWEITTAGRVQIEAKQQLKRRIGRSPDRADAVAMAFGTTPEPEAAIVVADPVGPDPRRIEPWEEWLGADRVSEIRIHDWGRG